MEMAAKEASISFCEFPYGPSLCRETKGLAPRSSTSSCLIPYEMRSTYCTTSCLCVPTHHIWIISQHPRCPTVPRRLSYCRRDCMPKYGPNCGNTSVSPSTFRAAGFSLLTHSRGRGHSYIGPETESPFLKWPSTLESAPEEQTRLGQARPALDLAFAEFDSAMTALAMTAPESAYYRGSTKASPPSWGLSLGSIAQDGLRFVAEIARKQDRNLHNVRDHHLRTAALPRAFGIVKASGDSEASHGVPLSFPLSGK